MLRVTAGFNDLLDDSDEQQKLNMQQLCKLVGSTRVPARARWQDDNSKKLNLILTSLQPSFIRLNRWSITVPRDPRNSSESEFPDNVAICKRLPEDMLVLSSIKQAQGVMPLCGYGASVIYHLDGHRLGIAEGRPR